ncbi:RICIN domain-containing protein [Dactylosporangium vinaceum]|uniref:RICIN domain-containing protein n=1 Tax=Dactylosporangium vinaceum TaxID=53362 RepID=A0ABV5MJN9_9ACTN|nr:RICIN domain-containing protein [Dactylosporangium vinaceum]UAB92657.1 RICIN domain-containing protein [Dactylosporangium vinaceum]
MRTSTFRRTATLCGGVALAAALLAGPSAAPAAAEDVLPPVKDQIIQPAGAANVLQPDGDKAGAWIVQRPRIGQAGQAPDSQVWTKQFPRIEAATTVTSKVLPNAFAFQPSLRPGRRPLCLDVVGDSQQAGAALELRPCDGTPSQAFVLLTNAGPTMVQNVGSGLTLTVQADGTVVQRGVFKRAETQSSGPQPRTKGTATQLFRFGPR